MIRKLILLQLLLFVVACKSPEARRPVKSSSGTFIKESVARNKKIVKKEEAIINAIMKADTTKEYLASENGFWYYYEAKDTLASVMPKVGDEVTFTYDLKQLNGDLIFSEEDNGLQNYIIDQTNQELISGIREGLKLMKAGEKVTFLFPSYKAFGYYGIENKLGTNVPIQSTVTLKTIESQENQ